MVAAKLLSGRCHSIQAVRLNTCCGLEDGLYGTLGVLGAVLAQETILVMRRSI